jgi:hypothetical protein
MLEILQSLSSEYVEVRALVRALGKKVAESNPELCAQAIGSALFGLQRLSSDSPEVMTKFTKSISNEPFCLYVL